MGIRFVTFLTLAALIVFAAFGFSMRWMSDDYCYAAAAVEGGVPGAIEIYYAQWFGRITQAGGMALATMAGSWFAAIFPALVITSWLFGLIWLVYELANWFGLAQPRRIALTLAPVLLLAILAGIPQIFQSLYWLSGVFPYVIPLVILTFMLAMIFRGLRPKARQVGDEVVSSLESRDSLQNLSFAVVVTTSVLGFIAALASESYAVIQAGLIGWTWLAIVRFPRARRPLILPLVCWSAVTLIAFVILLSSPGNTYRSEFFTPTDDLLTLISRSFESTSALIIASLVYFAPIALISALAACHLVVRSAAKPRLTRTAPFTLLIIIVGFSLLFAMNVPAIYATSLPPPGRVYSISQFVLVGVFAALGFVIGSRARRSPPLLNVLTIALLIVLPIMASVSLLRFADPVMRFARDWDVQESLIHEQVVSGIRDVIVPPLSVDLAATLGLDPLMTSPDYWINDCAARYYGVETFVVSAPS